MTKHDFARFAAAHIDRFQRGDWPDPDSAYWSLWRQMLEQRGVDPDVADTASVQMGFKEPNSLAKHRQVHIDIATRIQASRAIGTVGSPEDAARAQSRECEVCRGLGRTQVPLRGELRTLWEHGQRVEKHAVRYIPVTCRCPLGTYYAGVQSTRPADKRVPTYNEAVRHDLAIGDEQGPVYADEEDNWSPATKARIAAMRENLGIAPPPRRAEFVEHEIINF